MVESYLWPRSATRSHRPFTAGAADYGCLCRVHSACFDGGTPTLAAPFSGSAVFGIGINHIANNAKHPYSSSHHATADRWKWIVSADGVNDFGQRNILGRLLRSSTVSSPDLVCTNGFDPCTITDPLTGRSDQVTEIESAAKSWYDALLVSLQKKPTGGPNFRWGFNANYTFSKTFNYSNDDQIPFNGGEDAVNLIFRSNDLQLEKGYSPTDERHRFVLFGVIEAPWKLTISPIFTYSTRVLWILSFPS